MHPVVATTEYLDALALKPGSLNDAWFLANIQLASQSEVAYQKILDDLVQANQVLRTGQSSRWKFSYQRDERTMVAAKFLSLGTTVKMTTPAIGLNRIELRYTLVTLRVKRVAGSTDPSLFVAIGSKLSEGTMPVTDVNREEVRDG